jgi:hypothetical protein
MLDDNIMFDDIRIPDTESPTQVDAAAAMIAVLAGNKVSVGGRNKGMRFDEGSAQNNESR